MVEACFVSLAAPDVAGALTRCRLLGARRILVVPYFLFAGLLVDRISDQAHAWAAAHDDTEVVVGGHMGVDPRLVELVWHRYDEVAGGPVHMNCDGCLHRTPLPGYESRVGVAPPTATSRTSRTSRTR
jgi:sirohydrochlorin cobaltochelatase